MTTDLGTEVILAMADSGWPLAFHRDELVTWSPLSRTQIRIPADWFESPAREGELRIALLGLVVQHGLRWQEGDPRIGGHPFLS